MEKERILSTYTFPAKPSSDGYYHIYLTTTEGRKQIKAKNLDKLKEKVYQFENVGSKTFKQVFELMLDQKMKYIKGDDKKASVMNTVRILKSDYKRFFDNTEFENMPVDDITKRDIEEICYHNLQKYDLKKKAFLGLRGIIKQTLALAYEEYWIPENPYLRVNFKRYEDMLIEPTSISKRAHTDDELDKMLDYIHEHQAKTPSYVAPYGLELQILMGLRRGEIAPLEWSDVTNTVINITKEQLYVCKSEDNPKGYSIIVQHTKTHTDRQFPITDQIKEFLGRLKTMLNQYYPGTPYLFPAKTTKTGVITNFTVYKFYKRMCKNMGIELSLEMRKGPHSFRRNGITKVCNANGGNIMMASVLYGNSPRSASNHYYTGIDMTKAKEILEG
ncbi:MAG: tyrosine-type recombinase/integrase [Lachnospiraceae bacterium]|nr:tyrosine-type recombinase/integrase [Lachnospiraceae bacterium]